MSNKRGWAYPGWLGCLTAVGPNRSCVLRTNLLYPLFAFRLSVSFQANRQIGARISDSSIRDCV